MIITDGLKARLFKRLVHDEATGCWLWPGAITKRVIGYGVIKIHTKKKILTHRLSWLIHYGEIPPDSRVLHFCDVPRCWNPEHLFLGTQTDNMKDMLAKGRAVRNPLKGSDCHWAKLSIAQVNAIRKDDRLQKVIGREFGIVQQQVSRIKSGKRWASL